MAADRGGPRIRLANLRRRCDGAARLTVLALDVLDSAFPRLKKMAWEWKALDDLLMFARIMYQAGEWDGIERCVRGKKRQKQK
jgi:hypothetical protein